MESPDLNKDLPSNSKLPLNVDWWRDLEKNKIAFNGTFVESIKSFSPLLDLSLATETVIVRDSTIDSTGQIEIFDILHPNRVETERQMYEQNCRRLQCPSSRSFGQTLDDVSTGFYPEDIKMAYYGLSSSGICATAISISNWSQCSIIDLQGNKLSESSFNALASVLKKTPVTEINLSSTGISGFGPIILSKLLSSSTTIKKITLEDNQFDDSDGIILLEAAASSKSLRHLDLSKNHLGIRCGNTLKKLLDDNDVLEELDLSWNHLRMESTVAIARGFRRNNAVKALNLSWNGVDNETAKEFGLALRENDCLQRLELYGNRITNPGFMALVKGLEKNSSLKCLKVGLNTISQAIAEKVLVSIESGDLRNSCLEMLDFTNIIFKPNFQAAIDSVTKIRTAFQCVYGYENSFGKRKIQLRFWAHEAIDNLNTYLKDNSLTILDIFDKYGSNLATNVSSSNFRQTLKESNVPLNDEQISNIIDYLDSDNIGDINLSKLALESQG